MTAQQALDKLGYVIVFSSHPMQRFKPGKIKEDCFSLQCPKGTILVPVAEASPEEVDRWFKEVCAEPLPNGFTFAYRCITE